MSVAPQSPTTEESFKDTVIIDDILQKNKQWAKDVSQVDGTFFEESSKGQKPKALWLGCSDSRVPESTLVAARPGELFVHRNIANQFHDTDDSAQSCLAYAVENAKIQHVLVVGHTNCGGCVAAWGSPKPDPEVEGAPKKRATPLTRFLAPLIKLRHSLTHSRHAGQSELALDDLIEENVIQTVQNIVATETIQENWAKFKNGELPAGQPGVQVHGLIYRLDTGRLHDLHCSAFPPAPPPSPSLGLSPATAEKQRTNAQGQALSNLLEEMKIPKAST